MACRNKPWLSLACLCLVGLAAAQGLSHHTFDAEAAQAVAPEAASTASMQQDQAVLTLMLAPKQLQYQRGAGAWMRRAGPGSPAPLSLASAAKVRCPDCFVPRFESLLWPL